MADTKITALTALTGADPANDVIPIVDVSDTTMAASGTTKKISVNNILGASGTATLASATISGDLTVDTSTLKVDSANNRVGVGTLSAYGRLTVGVGSGSQSGTTTNVAAGLVDIDYATTGDINTRLSFVNSNGATNAAIDRIGNPNFNDNGNLAFLTRAGAGSLTERYRIAADGIATWSNVGGVAGTAMTLNSTGLGVGTSNFAYKINAAGFIAAVDPSFTGTGGSLIGAMLNNDNTAPGLDIRRWTGTAGTHGTTYICTDATGATFFYNGQQASNTKATSLKMTLDASGNLLVGTTVSPSGTKIGSIAKLGKVNVEGTNTVTVSTSVVALARGYDTGGLFFISGYNTSGGGQGWWLVAARGGTVTTIASDNATGLTVAFTAPGSVLSMNTTSGTLSVSCISMTNQSV